MGSWSAMLLVFPNVSSEATSMVNARSILPTQLLSGVLSDPTAMLFGLEEEVDAKRRTNALAAAIVRALRPGEWRNCTKSATLRSHVTITGNYS